MLGLGLSLAKLDMTPSPQWDIFVVSKFGKFFTNKSDLFINILSSGLEMLSKGLFAKSDTFYQQQSIIHGWVKHIALIMRHWVGGGSKCPDRFIFAITNSFSR